jgi:hypothetical protein
MKVIGKLIDIDLGEKMYSGFRELCLGGDELLALLG